MMHDGKELIGLLMVHVDDLLYCGNGKKYEDTMNKLKAEVTLTEKTGDFVYCGKKVIQDKDGIKVTQHNAAMAIQYADIDPRRRKQLSLTLSAEEKTELRRIIGTIGWLARQTRYDLLVDNSMLAQRTGNPVISDLVDANKLVKRCQEYADHTLVFKANIGI